MIHYNPLSVPMYVSGDRNIKIFDGADCYVINSVQYDLYIRIDHDKAVLAAFTNEITGGKKLWVIRRRNQHIIMLGRDKKFLSLRKFMYAIQKRVSLDTLAERVNMLHPMVDNLVDYSSENLYIAGESSVHNSHRSVLIDVARNIIEYQTKNHGIWFFTYSDLLYQVLCQNRVAPTVGSKSKTRPRFVIRSTGNDPLHISAGQLAYACYCGAVSSTESLCDELTEHKARMSEAGLVVDHADNNPHNNTIYNLSLMTERDNKAKGSATNLFVNPYVLCISVWGEGYRVLFGGRASLSALRVVCRADEAKTTMAKRMGSPANACFFCNNAQELLRLLKKLKNRKLDWIDSNLSPIANSRKHPELQPATRNARLSIAGQMHLAAMPEGRFWPVMADIELPV